MSLVSRFGYANCKTPMYSTLILFAASTVLLFLYLNRIQPHYFIDEAFHIPQTLRYCAWNFTQWDPKITTLPGLYLITTAILSPFNLCDTTYIRCINLLGTFINAYLIYNIIKENCKSNETEHWSNDVVSVNFVLLMLFLYRREHTKMTALAGLAAVLVRQTNIIWVGYFTIERALDIFDRRMEQPVPSRTLNTSLHLRLIWKQIVYELRQGPLSFVKFIVHVCGDLLPYITVCLLFVAFVAWNKGIVVGDRTAHLATVHICQILYLSAFVSLFSWPYAITHRRTYLRFLRRNLIFAGCAVAIMVGVIGLNTLVHPYVLADNRHYWFYVWNRFIGRYAAFKYLLVPIYCASLFAISRNIAHLRFLTQINYIACVCVVLIPQLLVEPRYFILPYIFYRLSMRRPERWQIYLESFTTLTINCLQFFIFVNKVFYWEDQPYAQRISW